MRRVSWLDQIVYRFQHQWETNPQYRAAATGVIGLVVVLTMCSAMLLLSTTANSALAAIGLGVSNNAPTGTPNTGTRDVNGYLQFQTPVVTYPPQTPPVVATIPDSQTPLPGPTATDTPSPTDTPTGGGGNYACSGRQNGISFNLSPCPTSAGQNVTFYISAPKYANRSANVLITFGCQANGCGSVYEPTQLDGSGNWSVTLPVPSAASGSQMPISCQVDILPSGPGATFLAPPVQ